MACNACWYLLARGDTRTAHDLAATCASTGATGSAMTTSTRWRLPRYLAWALRDMGRYAEARDLDQDTLARRRRVLGEDHPDTLASASNLANDLATSASIRRPASWTRTPWPAAAGCSARTTPTP